MKTRTSELIDLALDWAVAKCEGLQPLIHYNFQKGRHVVPHPYYEGFDYGFFPSTDWAQGGPIIERERINTIVTFTGETWIGHIGHDGNYAFHQTGPTPLVAAMRCYVASRFGEEIDVPEDLLS